MLKKKIMDISVTVVKINFRSNHFGCMLEQDVSLLTPNFTDLSYILRTFYIEPRKSISKKKKY